MAENKTNTKSVIVIGSVPPKVLMTPKSTVYSLDSKTLHTVILEYFNIKESTLSNFAFQSF